MSLHEGKVESSLGWTTTWLFLIYTMLACIFAKLSEIAKLLKEAS